MIKFITKSIRPLGILIIFLFTLWAIIGSSFSRRINQDTFIANFLNYTVSFENRFFDFRLNKQLKPGIQNEDIVLIKIDDLSLQKLGTWPIPRVRYAELLGKLKAYGSKVVAFDVFFPERSPDQGSISPDEVFAEAIRDFQQDGRRVFLAYTLEEGDPNLVPDHKMEEWSASILPEIPGIMFNDAIDTLNIEDGQLFKKKIHRYTFPIEPLVDAEVGLGSIDSQEDADGIFRHYQLINNIDTIYFGSLGLNAVEAHSGRKFKVRITPDDAFLELDPGRIEIHRGGDIKVRYVGGLHHFPSASMYEVLEAPIDSESMRELLGNKLVFIGSTALGAHDLRPSPVDPKMPGVLSHMNLAHMLLRKHIFRDSDHSLGVTLAILLVSMLAFILVQRFGNPFLDAMTIALAISGSYYLDQIYFMPEGFELKIFYTYFCLVACYSWNTFHNFYAANKEKRQIKGAFSRYVAPTVVDEMLKDPENIQVGGSKMDITCLFSDVRDFTSISEGLTATELAHSLNFYMGKMTDIVFETRGTLDKYIGDAIVALWGAPLPIGNHAQHAVEAAIQMMEAMPAINAEFQRLGRPEFKVGIGLNTGECSVGNMGSERIFSYTALGDNMNLGARLESLCKHYGAQILISEFTLERLDSSIKTRPIDRVIVKGKTKPVGVFEVLYRGHPMQKDPDALNFYLSALALFQRRSFREALEIFEQILITLPHDKPTLRYKALCQKFIEHPELAGEDFDVTKMTEK